jgi:hypothetical protein
VSKRKPGSRRDQVRNRENCTVRNFVIVDFVSNVKSDCFKENEMGGSTNKEERNARRFGNLV